jgi:hypothetical protein
MIDVINDVKPLLKQTRSCHFVSNNLVLESKIGSATLSIPQSYHYAFIQLKRVSGNGKIAINGKEILVLSKISHSYRIEYVEEIKLTRPGDSLGEIAVLGINLHTEELGEEVLSQNWKAILGRCKSYGSLRLVKDKLFASEGGFIFGDAAIKTFETDPPGAFTREGGVIKFTSSCEISRFEVYPQSPMMLRSNNVFDARVAPIPLSINSAPVTPILEGRTPLSVNVTLTRPESVSNPVLYDSKLVNEFALGKFPHTKNVKSLRSNNIDYLLLKSGGSYAISGSFLRPNVEYVAVINGKKLNGNGRLQVEITGGSVSNIIIENEMLDYYVSVKTGPFLPDAGPKINVSIPQSGSGEIIISRIQIIEGVQLYSFRNLKGMEQRRASQQSYEIAKTLSSLNLQFGAIVDSNTLDEVALVTKKYARQKVCFGSEETDLSVNGTIIASNFDGINWLNKIAPLFPTVTIQKFRSDSELTASIGNKFGIQPAAKIWLEPFDAIDESQLEILRKAKMVVTPSLPNASYLENKLRGPIVVHGFKPLPLVSLQEVPYFKNLKYIVGFHRNKYATQRLLDAWDPSGPRLVLIGARGRFPDFVTPVNEYVEYQKLLYILLQAQCVIDLPNHTDYTSAMLHFCQAAGLPIISSNWFVMGKANCDFILTQDKVEGFKLPTIYTLQRAIQKSLERKKENSNLDQYNNHLKSFMSLLMGAV